MKYVTLFAFLMMTFAMVSCGGDKDKSSSNKGFSTSKLSTQNGYYHASGAQRGALEVGGHIYPANQAYAQVMNMALQQAQMQNIQPVMHNGVQKFRAKITAQLMNYQQGYNQPISNQTGYTQATLMLQNVVIY